MDLIHYEPWAGHNIVRLTRYVAYQQVDKLYRFHCTGIWTPMVDYHVFCLCTQMIVSVTLDYYDI